MPDYTELGAFADELDKIAVDIVGRARAIVARGSLNVKRRARELAA